MTDRWPLLFGPANMRAESNAKATALFFVTAIALLPGTVGAFAGEVRVAVAANFTMAARDVGPAFEAATGHRAIFSFGSTGQLYAQISQAAPFAVFLAADQEHPRKAIDEGLAVPHSRFTYATGRIALFSRTPGIVMGEDVLRETPFDRIAIANPVTAPYGTAAVQAMKALGVYGRLKRKIVQGINIIQTFQFVATGNAEVGFVALSQVGDGTEGSSWIVPDGLYAPIAQDAVLLNRGADNAAAHAFMAFLRGPEARTIKEKYGYGAGE